MMDERRDARTHARTDGRTDGRTWATLNALPHSSNGGGIKTWKFIILLSRGGGGFILFSISEILLENVNFVHFLRFLSESLIFFFDSSLWQHEGLMFLLNLLKSKEVDVAGSLHSRL